MTKDEIEEAAKKVCQFCANGEAVVRHEVSGEFYHPKPQGDVESWRGMLGAHPCFASRIWEDNY